MIDEPSREFDCPQCTKAVPFRRVRAVRIISKVEAEQFGKYQNPIERGLARQFGEYLMKEGLIRFGMNDETASMVSVNAEINIVTPTIARLAGVKPAEFEVEVDPPPLPARIRNRVEITAGYDLPGDKPIPFPPAKPDTTMAWEPRVFTKPETKKEALRKAVEQRAAMNNRFSGIDLGDDDT
jgi:hypothetical protein